MASMASHDLLISSRLSTLLICCALCPLVSSLPACDAGLGLIQKSPLLRRIEHEVQQEPAKTFTPVDGGVNRACRGAHAGDNQGTYFVVRSADDIAGCKLLCEETANCGGIEYHTSGRCEVWIRPDGVGASIALDGYTCLRYGSESDGFLDVDGGIDRSCRGATENDNNPSHYTVVLEKTQQQCKQLCRENMACVGIEHAGTRCEIWTRAGGIQSSHFTPGSLCQKLEFTYVDGSLNRACRGETVSDNAASYFSIATEGSLGSCKKRCRKTPGCVGIEFINTRCEVWTRPEGIKVGKEASGYTCLRYHGGLQVAPSTKQELNARFLIQATFGPTLSTLAELGATTYDAWIDEQMSLPPSLLRVYYRQRVNPRPVLHASLMESGRPASRCATGSRWVNNAILKSDKYRKIKVSNNKIFVDGLFRTDIDPLFIGNALREPNACADIAPRSWQDDGYACATRKDKVDDECTKDSVWKEDLYCEQTCFDVGLGYEGDDCSPGWPSLSSLSYEGYICKVGGNSAGAWLRLGTTSGCESGVFTAMLIPAVWKSNPDDSILQPLQFDVFRPGVLLLKAPPAQCNLGTIVQSDAESAGQFYMLEERLELLENTLENPAATGVEGSKCPTVPKTFLNEHSCKLLPGCLPLGQPGLSVSLTLENLEKFFTVGGRYVYVVSGLRTTSSPCGKVSRWKQLACGSGCVASNLPNATIERIQASLEEGEGSFRDIDVSCSDVEAESIVQVGGAFFQHVHIDEGNVFDFTDWTLQHPGGAAKIKQFTTKGYNLVFPSWHPMERWDSGVAPDVIGPGFVGKMGSSVLFHNLPQPLQTETLALALGAEAAADLELSEVCGSPGEVANNPQIGHHFAFDHGVPDKHDWWLDTDYGYWNDRAQLAKTTVWTMRALFAQDQLRQRAAWALSQIYVCSVYGGGFSDRTEPWLNYYDIFVRHAFGNLRDVIREVTYNPIMGNYLTYKGNRALDSTGRFPDENYAREVMQLFSIGLWKLNPDGSQMLDANGHPIPTYSNDDIMNFARVFTGFDQQRDRGNMEDLDGQNRMDPMQMKADWHDKYPKPNLHGEYLGDGYPLCSDAAEQAFLKKGARYSFVGKTLDDKQGALKLSSTSDLFKSLCFDTEGTCKYNLTVELQETLACNGNECTSHTVNKVDVQGGLYEYLEPTCVNLFFFNGQKSTEGGRKFGWSSTTKCRDPNALIAGISCCSGCKNKTTGWMNRKGYTCENAATKWPEMYTEHCNLKESWRSSKYCELACFEAGVGYEGSDCSHGPWEGQRVCNYDFERVRFATAEKVCEAKGLEICPQKLENYGCSYNDIHVWTQDKCTYEVLVHPGGLVSSNWTSKTRQNKFSVHWKDDNFPSSTSPSPCSGCRISGDLCSCDMTVETRPVFSSVPTVSQLSELKIGAAPPTFACSDNCDQNVRVYKTGSTIDEQTVFEHQGMFYSNKAGVVLLSGGYEFRNPPVFMPTVYAERRHALAEVESLIDHLFQHPNTAPFISYRLIQRLVTSNPSRTYVKDVADAFKTGMYGGKTYSGKYGDLAATFAAILLHSEARFPRSLSDGALREPLLKFLHIMRSLEYKDKQPNRLVVLDFLQDTIGQFPFRHKSVFSYYLPDFKPDSFPDGLVAPEFQIFTPTQMINFVNGAASLIDRGFGSCDRGFGTEAPDDPDGSSNCAYGQLELGALDCIQPTLDQLDLLLTGGRLNKSMLRAAYDEATGSDRYKVVQKAVILSPEFNTMGNPFPMGLRPVVPPEPVKEPQDYKAVVMVFLNGGADTFNMLVPLNCPLYDEYHTVRKNVALDPSTLHKINAPTQSCPEFGIHYELDFFKELYDSNELAFAANVGSLVEPLDKASYKSSGERCVGLFSHSDQQRAAQTLTCQYASQPNKGAGGRLADALAGGSKKLRTMSFSLQGHQPWTQGFETSPQIITNGEPIGIQKADQLQAIIDNITSIQHGNIYCEEYNQRVSAAIDFTAKLRKSLRSAKLETGFYHNNQDLTKQLREVARLISTRAERKVERDVFFVQMGGFDNHRSVGVELGRRFDTVNNAFKKFVTEMKAQGMFESVVMVTHSDFGRTLTPNSGSGTDHAWAGNYVIAGGGIKGGKIFNSFPKSLLPGAEQDAGRGRLIPKFPFENFMLPIAQWMGLEQAQLSNVFPNIGNFNSSVLIDQADLFK